LLLTVEGLSKRYKTNLVVDNIEFDIQPNQCVALLGPNGAGKTTTLQMLSGLLKPDSGLITFQGCKNIDRTQIGFLPQYPSFFPWMTAVEFLHFAGKLSKMEKGELKDKINNVLHFVDLHHAKNKKIGGFSGGMKQRLGLAQALIHEPKLLVLDEPVSALDPTGRRDVLRILEELKKKTSILFSTHILHDAEQVCDEIIMMKAGKVKWSGSIKRLKERTRSGYFFLKTEGDIKSWLSKKDYIREANFSNSSTVTFKLTSNQYRNCLLEDCIKQEITIIHFEERSGTLEDAYMEVMG